MAIRFSSCQLTVCIIFYGKEIMTDIYILVQKYLNAHFHLGCRVKWFGQMSFQYHLMLLVKAAFGMNSLITIKRELQTKYLPISINLLLKGLQIRANSFFLSL